MPSQSKLVKAKCPICFKTFRSSKHYLTSHMRIHNGDNPHKCVECDMSFKFYSDLSTHQRTVHLGEVYQCKLCNKLFSRQSNLNLHMRTVHNQEKRKYHQCVFCSKYYKSWLYFQTHIFTHTGERPFECKICNKNFNDRSNLKIHLDRVHTEKRAFVCNATENCKKGFKSQKERQQHIKRQHPAAGSSFNCDICNTTFKSQVYLTLHQKGKHGSKKHVCKLCGKRFTLWQYLKQHLLTHTGEKPFKCEICFKSFGSVPTYIIHKKRHSTATAYKCKECPKEFRTPDDLHSHRKRHHSTVRLYYCTFCGENKRYIKPFELFEHLRSHVGEKPYFCNICNHESLTATKVKLHFEKFHRYFGIEKCYQNI